MAAKYNTLDDWIQDEAITFSMDTPASFNAAVDRLVAGLDETVNLLGLGEAFHGVEDFLILRNRLFQRLAAAHGFSAIAIESSFPQSRLVNEYVTGRTATIYAAIQETGFSNGFGRLAANRELVEWMRAFNADPANSTKLHFYGADMPLLEGGLAGPRPVLYIVLDYLEAVDGSNQERRRRIDGLIGADEDWENTAALTDPTQAVGQTPAAANLRLETEELISELRIRRPELAAKTGPARLAEAIHYAKIARQLLNYHAGVARGMDYGPLLCLRDTIMADNLVYLVEQERERGKVLFFAHNSHVQRGQAVWPWYTFWPAGSQLKEIHGSGYAAIGTAIGSAAARGIAPPEPDTLEARLNALPEPAVFIPTHAGRHLPPSEIAALPTRTGSPETQGYQPLTAQSFTDFDWLAVLGMTADGRQQTAE